MTSEHFDAVIVGAGFAGIGAAIQLKRNGVDDFVILDREDDLGGTWYVNHYPRPGRGRAHDDVFVLLRAQPELVAPVHPPGPGDQAVRRRRRRQVRRPQVHALQHHRRGCALGRGRQPLADRPGRRRHDDGPLSHHRDGIPVPARGARHPGHRRLRRQGRPHHPVGGRLRSRGPSHRGDRHRRHRGAADPRTRQAGRRPRGLSTHPRSGWCPRSTCASASVRSGCSRESP